MMRCHNYYTKQRLFEVDISHPFSPDITYRGFIDEYRVKIHEVAEKYKKIKNEPEQLPLPS